MSSPAERYARARRRGPASHLGRFADTLDFPLDDFQTRACAALEDGRGVLVAAPTGAGKTVVGEFAVHLALAAGRKAFYTTPIKALSNQKYADLARRHGADRVGLLTGDTSVNGEAPVVVMTTEVLRNMLYAGSATLRGLGYVVMDEVHYLADRFRGAVWEEVIIHLPDQVAVVSLSATVSNAEEFGAWLGQVRGPTEVVVEEHRPVPLWQHMLVGRRLYDLLVEQDPPDGRPESRGTLPPQQAVVNRDLLAAIRERGPASGSRRGRLEDAGGPRGRRGRARGGARAWDHGTGPGAREGVPAGDRRRAGAVPARPGMPGRAEVVALLDREGLLPAITFIFSRAGCDAAVHQLLAAGIRLVGEGEGAAIRRIVEARVAGIATEDLGVLGYWDFVEGLSRGFAAHHAGMLPTFRETVEELFVRGLVRSVFATETLALGINMPARSVVLEKLVKFNGETHADVTPAEYTQLTGRAGRRGIDVEGHAVVLWSPRLDPEAVAGLASTRTYPLRSSFAPTYNMTVNLVDRVGRDRARSVLEMSFAQFQADRAVAGLSRQIREREAALAGYAESMSCHLGDFCEYMTLRRQIGTLEKDASRARSAARRDAVTASVSALRAGDVVRLPDRHHGGRAVVVTSARATHGPGARPSVVTEDGRLRRIAPDELHGPLELLGRIRVPKRLNPRRPRDRQDLAATVRAQVPDDPYRPPRDTAGTGTADTDTLTARSGREVGVPAAAADVEGRIGDLRRRMREHPCHGCADREHHARWAERHDRLDRETEGLRRKVAGRTDSLARTFDRLARILTELGYLTGSGPETAVTAAGRRLARLYTERDLFAAECLRHGLWSRLDPPSLAAVVSCLVHEPRGEGPDPSPRMPTEEVLDAHEQMVRLWSDLQDREERHGLAPSPYPDAGIAWMIHRWGAGARLETVLRDSGLVAGDFVRRCKQTVDLLDQIAQAAPEPALRSTARAAVDALMRGVVAADRLD